MYCAQAMLHVIISTSAVLHQVALDRPLFPLGVHRIAVLVILLGLFRVQDQSFPAIFLFVAVMTYISSSSHGQAGLYYLLSIVNICH